MIPGIANSGIHSPSEIPSPSGIPQSKSQDPIHKQELQKTPDLTSQSQSQKSTLTPLSLLNRSHTLDFSTVIKAVTMFLKALSNRTVKTLTAALQPNSTVKTLTSQPAAPGSISQPTKSVETSLKDVNKEHGDLHNREPTESTTRYTGTKSSGVENINSYLNRSEMQKNTDKLLALANNPKATKEEFKTALNKMLNENGVEFIKHLAEISGGDRRALMEKLSPTENGETPHRSAENFLNYLSTNPRVERGGAAIKQLQTVMEGDQGTRENWTNPTSEK